MSMVMDDAKTVLPVQPDLPPLGKGAATRGRILDIAQAAILAKGFAATSIEEVIAEAGITKGGFFYHFKDKNELARELLRRYIAENDQVFDSVFARGQELADDPLDGFLISLKLLAGVMGDLPSVHPGCLIAAICYQERLFDRQVRELITESVVSWNQRFMAHLETIAAIHPVCGDVDLEQLARMLSCIVDGAIIMSKSLQDPKAVENQILAYRAFVRLAFAKA